MNSALPTGKPFLESNTVRVAVAASGVSLAAVAEVLGSPESLLRLNPCLEIKAWERLPHPRAEIWRLHCFNEMNGVLSDRTVLVRPLVDGNGYRLEYREGIKEFTQISWQWDDVDTTVVEIQESYRPGKVKGGDQPLLEVDPSLSVWAAEIRRYLVGGRSWGWMPWYGWYRHRWMVMTPNQRRLLKTTLWTTGLEVSVVILLFVAYLLY